MKNSRRHYIPFLVLWGLIIFSHPAYGAGYEISEQDTRAMGMASAFVAQADNPSAVYYNTAGLSRIRKTAVSLGVTQVGLDFKLKNNGASETDRTRTFYIPNFYLSVPLVDDKLTVGLGVYSPYGLGMEWDEDGITKYSAVKSEMQTVFITPALAWKPIPQVSLGAGVSYIQSDVLLTRKAPYSVLGLDSDADVTFKGDAQSWGWTTGIQAYPTDKLSLGFSYRSETILKYKGTMELDNIPQPFPASYDTDAKTEFPLPQRFSFGAAYKILDNWTVELDYERVRWSAMDSLEVNVEDENALLGVGDEKYKKSWRDTNVFKLGTEVLVIEHLALRCGGAYYQSAIPDRTLDPMIPENDRYGITLGVGYKIGGFTADIGFAEIFSPSRSVNNNVLEGAGNNPVLAAAGLRSGRDRYENHTRMIALSLGYNF